MEKQEITSDILASKLKEAYLQLFSYHEDYVGSRADYPKIFKEIREILDIYYQTKIK